MKMFHFIHKVRAIYYDPPSISESGGRRENCSIVSRPQHPGALHGYCSLRNPDVSQTFSSNLGYLYFYFCNTVFSDILLETCCVSFVWIKDFKMLADVLV